MFDRLVRRVTVSRLAAILRIFSSRQSESDHPQPPCVGVRFSSTWALQLYGFRFSSGLYMQMWFVVTLLLVSGCGVFGPTDDPSDNPNNLDEAPASAHTVSTSDLTIKSWFDLSPPKNSAITPGTPYSITNHCRHSDDVTGRVVTLGFDHIASDGSASRSHPPGIFPFEPFHIRDGFGTVTCGSAASSGTSGTIPAGFAGLREAHISAWFQSDAQSSIALPTTPPDGVFVETINWTVAP